MKGIGRKEGNTYLLLTACTYLQVFIGIQTDRQHALRSFFRAVFYKIEFRDVCICNFSIAKREKDRGNIS